MTELVRYHRHTATDSCIRHALVEEVGKKKLRVLLMLDNGVTTKVVPRREDKYMTPVDHPLKKAARSFKRAGKTLGITKGAKQMLRRVS